VRLGTLGDGTRSALEAVGLHDELGCNVPDGAALAQAFLASVTAPCRILMPGAVSRLSEPAKSLRAAGCEVQEVPLYRTSAVPRDQLPTAPLAAGDVIFFCSPTAVRAFAAAWKERPDCVAIGATTAAVAREAGFAPEVAATPDLEAMLRAAGLGSRP
jgi:uroporphyrinogen-III synthase